MGRPQRAQNDNLIHLLDLAKLSQADLAMAFHVSRQAVNFWCSRGVPAERLYAVSQYLKCTPQSLRPDLW